MQEKSSSSSLSSRWVITYSSKLQFFLKIRRFFLLPKKPTKKLPFSYTSNHHKSESINTKTEDMLQRKTEHIHEEKTEENTHQSKKPTKNFPFSCNFNDHKTELMDTKTEDMLQRKTEHIHEEKTEENTHQSKKPTKNFPFTCDFNDHKTELMDKKTEKMEEIDEANNEKMVLQRAVKQILFGKWEEKENGVKEIKRLASEDVKITKSLAELGVIPPLVSMLDSDAFFRRHLVVQVLTQFSDASFTNKALILEAGILTKLPTKIEDLDSPLINDFSQLILSISSLCNTQFPFNHTQSKLISFLLNTIQSNTTNIKAKESCLATLYNLSKVLENTGPLISNQVVDILLSILSSSKAKISEHALAILGNLVVTLMGKKALEENEAIAASLIDVLTWDDKSKCQELSIYVLMILGHKSSKQRDKMKKLGIVHNLLEVALLGSPLAQKRAFKLLQWFKDERKVRVGAHSGPQTRLISMGSPMSDGETNEGKRLMKKMVKQSLCKNMEVITKRANVALESSKVKSLVVSSSSKSLPY